MPSLLDSLMGDGASVLTEAFGERDEAGDLTTVTMNLPGAAGDIELVGCRVESLSQAILEDGKGNVKKRETTILHIPRRVNELELRLLQRSKFVIACFGSRIWVPQNEGAIATDTYLTYPLEREPLANLDDKRVARNS